MRAWQFSENAYPYLPPAEEYESIRINLPNRNYDPAKGAALYDRYIDEWLVAEDEGLEIMLNEHHQTATCVDPAAPIVLGALARLSKKARLLILGNPVANRNQPVRVAEEMALIDILSKGRLECGFVRGVPYEVLPANSNPTRMNERQWEAIDLIVKAWTHHDGPFSHEGRFFHHRTVNIWPRPYQQPHPPIWISTTTPSGAQRVGTRGYVQATFLTGFEQTREIYSRYRKGWAEAGRGNDVPVNRLAYAAMVYVAKSEKRRPRRRRQTAVVHAGQQGAVPSVLSARLHAGAGADAGAAGRGPRPACRDEGQDGRRARPSKPASCSPARPIRSIGRSRSTTSSSAATAIC